MSELKSCPFCGYEPETKEIHVYPNGEKSPAFIKCKRCNYHLFGYNEEELFVHWNHRPIEDALRSELDQLREQMRWRKYPDEKPTKEGEYLVLMFGSIIEQRGWEGDVNKWEHTKGVNITHWMPRPQPPEEEA